MKWKRVLSGLVVCCLLSASVARSGSYTCSSFFNTYLGQLALMVQGPNVRALLASEEFRFISSVSPGMAAYSLSAASSADLLGLYEPSETGEWSWVFKVTENYRVVESDIAETTLGEEGHLRLWTTTASAYLIGDRWGVTFQMPYSNWDGYGAYENYGGESLGLTVTPQYFVMKQSSESVDLSVFAVLGYERVWFSDDPGFDDPESFTYGLGVLLGKTFSFGDISLGYSYQPWRNTDGDEGLDGTDTTEFHNAALTYTFAVTDNLYASLQTIWEYTENLPDEYDSDQYLGRAKLMYETECWGVQASFGRTLYSDDFSEWDTDLSVVFRW